MYMQNFYKFRIGAIRDIYCLHAICFSVGLCVAPCAIQMLTMPFCPESPRYLLIKKEKEDDAHSGKVLRKFY